MIIILVPSVKKSVGKKNIFVIFFYDLFLGLNSLSLTKSMLKNKPNKTECEDRVLAKMIEKTRRERFLQREIPTIHSVPTFSNSHVVSLTSLENPLPIALAIIADYLHEKRMRLLDLFSKADRNKDWLTTREELGKALKVRIVGY